MKFDDNQISVIEADSGPLLVTAGPGSGKTAVLTHRILYLHEKLKIPFERILVITFTKAAAVQMKSRFEKITESDSKVTFCTFHSLFYSIIKDFKSENIQIISLNEKLNILKTVLLNENIDLQSVDFQLILDEFSYCKNTDKSLNDFISVNFEKNIFLKIYNELVRQNLAEITERLLKELDFIADTVCIGKCEHEGVNRGVKRKYQENDKLPV